LASINAKTWSVPLRSVNNRWWIFILIPASALFFIGGPTSIALPSWHYAWNLGHIAFFALLAFTLHAYRLDATRRRLVWLFLSVLFASLLIELVQFFLGRDWSLIDIGRNLTGFTLGLSVFPPKKIFKPLVKFATVFLLVDVAGFVFTAAGDEYLQTRAPIIENFETPVFRNYWSNNIQLTDVNPFSGDYAAMVNLKPARYAGFSLSPVMRDWSGYRNLSLAVNNGSSERLTVTIRINDVVHQLSEQNYNDRFNQRFDLDPGWNSLSILLRDIQTAPSNRLMQLKQMFKIGIFISGLRNPVVLGLDEVVLERD